MIKFIRSICFTFFLYLFIVGFNSIQARDLYWIGKTINWNDGQNWSLQSGGVSINDVPNENDNVYFDNYSFQTNSTVSISTTSFCKNFYWNTLGYSVLIGSGSLNVYGSMSIFSNYSNQYFGTINFKGGSQHIINIEQAQLNSDINFQGNGAYTLEGNLANQIENKIVIQSGQFNSNGKIVYTGSFISIGTSSRSINLATSRIIIGKKIKITGSNLVHNVTLANLEYLPTIEENEIDLGDAHFGTMQNKAACAGGLNVTASVTSNYNGAQISCGGVCDGQITINASGTPGPFRYSLNGTPCVGNPTSCAAGAGNVFNGLCAGTYNAIVIDSSQLLVPIPPIYLTCTEFGVVIVAPPLIEVSVLFIQNPTCPTSCDGQIFTSIGGGTGALSILWPNIPSTVSNPTGVCTGINPVQVTDQNGCVVNDIVTVADPPGINANLQILGVSCDGVCNGQAFSIPTGGNGAPYTFEWTNLTTSTVLGTTNPITGLCEITNYNLHIEDLNGCEYDTVFSLVDKLPPVMNVDFTIDATCANLCDGQIGISFSGGTATVIQVNWYQGVFGSGTIFALNGGFSQNTLCPNTNYYITYLDNEGCTDSIAIPIISAPPAFNYSESHVNISCNGAGNGSINVTLSGGTPGYTYAWSTLDGGPFNPTSQDQSNLSGGTYTIVYTDALGCTDTDDITITEPAPLFTSGIVTNVGCFNQTNGAINITPTGGTLPYTFTWTSSPNGNLVTFNSEDQSGLDSAIYHLHIVDGLGCVYDTSFNLTKPGELFFNTTISPILCNGDNNAVINHSPTNGVLPYTFVWSTTGASVLVPGAEDQSGLTPASYTTTITDFNGCTKDTTITITQPSALNLSESHINNTCFQSNDASITIVRGGGTAPLTLVWNPSPTPIANNVLNPTGLSAGLYTATLTDANGCNTSVNITISEPTPLSVSLIATDLPCNGVNTGSITSNVTGGTSALNYIYSWTGPNGFVSASQNITNLFAGTYCLNVLDDNNCNLGIDSCISIIEPDSIFFNGTIVTPITCFGANNGSVNLNVTGGTVAGNYTFSWTGPGAFTANTQNISGLSPGTYNVTVTDDNGCTNDTSITFVQPPALTISETHVDISCFQFNDGSINLTVGGGTPPLSTVWSPAPTPIANNVLTPTSLSPGNYTATVTDFNGCNISISINLTQPNPITVNLSGSDLLCNGINNGSISTNVVGGTVAGNYIYSWTGSNSFTSTNQNISNLLAGTYCLNLQDDNGCSLALDSCILISEPAPIFFNGTIVTPISCFNANNGAVDLTVIGGTIAGNYNFSWTGPGVFSASTEDIIGLAPGTYDVIVTDDNGCTNDTSFTFTQPLQLSLTTSSNPTSCNTNDGTVTVTPVGGTVAGNYSIQWSNGGVNLVPGTALTEINLGAGCYDVLVTDDNGCTATGQECLNSINPPNVAFTITDATCNGACDGSISIVISAGTAPYTTTWTSTNPGFVSPGTNNIFGLCAADYTLNVTDAANCSFFQTVTVGAPTSVSITAAAITNVSCFGGNNGAINITPSGGTVAGNYTFSWTGSNSFSSTNEDAFGLALGNYCVRVTDDNGCFIDSCFAITQPTDLIITSISSTDAQCNVPSGSVTVVASGGTGLYSYSWVNLVPAVVGNTQTVNGVLNDVYTVTVSDANGCTVQGSVPVNPTNGPAITVDNFTNVLCAGGANGTITTSAFGGTGALTYSWSSVPAGFTAGNVPNLSGLSGGTYVVTVGDGAACNSFEVITITEPLPMTILDNVIDALCFGATGTIDITVQGGTSATGTYSYDWSFNGFGAFVDPEDVSLTAGSYSVIVADDNGCSITGGPYIINQPTEITLSTNSTQSACTLPTGSVSVVASNGTPGYTYQWFNAISGVQVGNTASVSNLLSGCYNVFVTDFNSCIQSTNVCVSDLNGPVLSAIPTNIICNGAATGAVNLTVVPTSGVQSIAWTSLLGFTASTEDISGLVADDYAVIVTETNGCVSGLSVSITESIAISITASLINPDCFNSPTGAIDITVLNAVGAPVYSWTGPNGFNAATEDIIGLVDGVYSVTIIDANNCQIDTSITLGPLPALTVTTTSQTSACTSNTGVVTALAIGGVPGYSYVWTSGTFNGVNGATEANLAPDTYTVTVTDANGCVVTATETVTFSNPPIISLNSVNNADCFGNSSGSVFVTVSSGTPGYTYTWSGPAGFVNPGTEDIINVPQGTYTLNVVDAAGCPAGPSSFNVLEPTQPLSISGNTTNILCNGANNGTVNITVSGGTVPFNFTWSQLGVPFSASEDVNGLGAGTFDVLVVDANGCTISDSYSITEPTALTVSASGSTSSCNLSDGSVSSVSSGGTVAASYTFQWTDVNGVLVPVPGGTSPNVVNLPQGSYLITITDDNGCTASDIATISDFNGPTVTFTQVNVLCFGDLSGQIDISANGTIPLSYAWTGPSITVGNQTNEDQFGIQAGNYTVAVTDGNNCVTNQAISLTGPLSPISVVGIVNDVTCFGLNDGAIDLTVSGGTSPYTVNWNGSNGFTSTFQDITNLSAALYTLDIIDNNGCSLNGNVFNVIDATSIVVTPTIVEPTCGLSDGSVSVVASGGSVALNYSYSWFDITNNVPIGVIVDNIQNIAQGNFEVTVTDDNGCQGIANVSVSDDNAPPLNFATTNIDCNGNSNGAINLTVGGINVYTYTWSTPNGSGIVVTDEDQSGLTVGDYFVTVFDASTGCTANGNTTITQPNVLNASAVLTNLSCFGDNSGAINLTITGGTSPYTIDWNNIAGVSNPEDQNGIAAGTYIVSIIDANGCNFNDSYTLTEPLHINVTGLVTNNNCNGQNQGSIDVTVTDGVAPYSYSWSNGSTNEDISLLVANTYTVTVTDFNGCFQPVTFNVTEPNPFIFNIVTGNSNCLVATGTATATVSGGTLTSPDYTYDWQHAGLSVGNSNTIVNQFSGLYTLFITDDNGCSADSTVAIVDNNGPVLTVNSIVNVSCNGANTGQILVSTTAGTAPYSYVWNPGAIALTEDLIGVPAGNYILQATDANGCASSINASVTESSVLSSSAIVNDATCGICNGSATATGIGGAGGYTFIWSNGVNGATATNLCAGVYSVQITDANGCSSNEFVSINNVGGPTGENIVTSDANCANTATGSATVTGVGGVTPYSYFWPHSGAITSTVNNLSAGTYFVQIIDNNGCIRNTQVDIFEPNAIIASGIVTPATCGGNDGSITVTANGGIAPLTYNWSGGLGTNVSVPNLNQGGYTVTITDNNGCSISQNFTVPGINSPNITLNPTNASCFGTATGSINSTVNGAVGALTYQWLDGSLTSIVGETNPIIINLVAGTYTLQVTDAGTGCLAFATVTLNQPNNLQVTVPNTVDASCITACNGQATAVVSGGTLPYSYLWTSGATSSTATNLCYGVNVVTITDAQGCLIQQSITTDENPTLIATVSPIDATCGLCDGSASLVASGGSGNYSFLWNTGATANSQNNLCAGIYGVDIIDNTTSCVTQQTVTINNINGPDNEIVTITDVTCNGGTNGSANVVVSGGTPAYNYNWLGQGVTSNTLSNVGAGNYVLQVSDNNGCIRMVPVTINEPNAPTVQFIAEDGTCGNSDGSITLFISQDNAPYAVNWISGPSAVGSSSLQEINLLPGIYTISISDALGCLSSVTIPLGTTNGPQLSTSSTNVSCNGLSDGSVQVTANGTGPFSYNWTSGSSLPLETNLIAGTYFVSVTDALGCVSNTSASVVEPTSIIASLPNVQNASCDVSCDGQATVLVSGGTLAYTYLWDNGAVTQSANNLCVGVNTITVTDANGCSTQQNIIVNASDLLTSTFNTTNATCGDCDGISTVIPSGGSGNYSVLWFDNNASLTHANLCAGIYSYAVTDNITGCQTQMDATVNNVNGPDNETITQTDVTCNGGNNGTASVVVTGGTLPYTYLWSPTGSTLNNISGLSAGTYHLEVSDANDCKRVVTVNIAEPQPISINYIAQNPNCGASDGSITTAVTNATNPISYSWNGPGGFTSNASSISNLAAGNYSVTISDNTGCSVQQIVSVNSTTAPQITTTSTNVTCFGLSTGSASVTSPGNFSYLWSNGGSTSTINNLAAGNYFVEVTDNLTGCIANQMVIVNEPLPIQFGTPFIDNMSCFGICDGELVALANGGTVPYSFDWSTGGTTASINGLCANTYSIEITDANGCVINANVDITEPTQLVVVIDNVIDALCVNSNDGAINVTASGGTPNYTYSWSTSPSSAFTSALEDIANLNPTNYLLTVTDDNGCTANTSASVDTLHIVLANAGVDGGVCLNDCVTLTGTGIGPGALNYQWQTISGTIISNADTAQVCGAVVGFDNYVLLVSDAFCFHTDTIQVQTYPLPFANAGADISNVLGTLVSLGGSPTGPTGSTYSWSPNTNMIDASGQTSSNPFIELTLELDYVVFVTDTNGCVNSDTIHVRPIPQIVFPNGFTPNGDGVNDDWQIDYIDQFPNCTVEVFNRWGQQLFYSVGYTTRWNGRYNGKELPVGTYYYVIELNDPLFPDTYSGPITIMR